jgi:uncharacterized protein
VSDILVYLYLFVLFSLAGWVLEFSYRSGTKKSIVNPGFLRGPYLPLYGVSAVAITAIIMHPYWALFPEYVVSTLNDLLPPVFAMPWVAKIVVIFLKGVFYLIVTTGIELITALVFRGILRKPLWDYSREVGSLKASICPRFSFCWVLLSFLLEYLLLPLALSAFLLLHPLPVIFSVLAVCFVISFDFTRQLSRAFGETRRGRATRMDDEHREFASIVEPLLETPEVSHLADYRHHRDKSRLDHSLEVAWGSYLISKRLSLDFTSAARGGLLHDLFFYDWMREGPRLHGLRHPRISLENAEKIADLNPRERDIIEKHMWPLTLVPPRYPEAWSTCFVDTYYGVKDYATGLAHPRRVSGEG